MFYPATFEEKIGFDQIRQLLAARCVSAMGRREVEAMQCGVDRMEVENNLLETNEFKQLILLDDPFPLQDCHDLLPVLSRIAIDGTFIELDELADLRALLQTVVNVVVYFRARTCGTAARRYCSKRSCSPPSTASSTPKATSATTLRLSCGASKAPSSASPTMPTTASVNCWCRPSRTVSPRKTPR